MADAPAGPARRLRHRQRRPIQRPRLRQCRCQGTGYGKIHWQGEGVNETGYLGEKEIVKVDPRYFRPTEVETLLGDASKAKEKLGWTPKITFAELVSEMVREDLKSAERDELITNHGYKAMAYHE